MKKILAYIFLSVLAGCLYAKELFRVVVLSPNLSEITHSIIEASDHKNTKIVGLIHYFGEPDFAKSIQGVGDANTLNVERIILLQPDIVLASPMNSPIAIEQMTKFGLNVEVLDANSLKEINTLVLEIGRLIHLPEAAQEISSKYLTELHKLKNTYRNSQMQSVFIQLSQVPLFTVGNKGVINEIITLCHGKNIFSDIPYPSFQIGIEKVLIANPNMIFQLFIQLKNQQSYTINPHSQWQSWQGLSAVANNNVYLINPNLISQNTPSILKGAKVICQLIAQNSVDKHITHNDNQ